MEKRASSVRTRKSASRKASTDDVLAGSERREKVPAKWAEYHKRLVALRDHLSRERQTLKQSAAEESPQFSLHMADAGTDSFDRDFALGMLSNEQDALYQIEQALDRIRTGTYGKCEVTGQPIARDRLLAIPWTRFSVDAERQLEKEGAAERSKARLGGVEKVTRITTENKVGEQEEES
jgi:RNA polymerase-binding transcription factor DksA